jgi:hypothetical protein
MPIARMIETSTRRVIFIGSISFEGPRLRTAITKNRDMPAMHPRTPCRFLMAAISVTNSPRSNSVAHPRSGYGTHVMEQANTLPIGSCSSPEVTRRCRAEVGGCYRQLQFPVRTPAALACICSSTRPGKRGQRMRVKRPPVQVGPGPRPAQRLNRLRPTHVAVTPSAWLIAADVPLGHLRRSAATAKPATISSLLAAF